MASKQKQKLVIIGNGMVSASFCEHLVAHGLTRDYDIVVLGDEVRPAYNRVKLSTYFQHNDAEKLQLLGGDWYQDNGIELRTGCRVESVDVSAKTVTSAGGESFEFDRLVFATGSRPFVPSMPGTDHLSVHVYRDIEDLDGISSGAEKSASAAVLGGGLLGLEAAHGLRKLGVENVHIVQLASLLLSKQLNKAASIPLEEEVKNKGYEIHLNAQTESITRTKGGGCRLHLKDREPLDVDMVVIATGIQPNSELAEEAGLRCGVRGGIIVDKYLETETPGIYAIGECALSEGKTYGLVAPGYQMAETLAYKLSRPDNSRRRKTFSDPDLSTRLKMIGVDVAILGDHLQPGKLIEYSDGPIYRALTLGQKDKLAGAMAVGQWDEVSKVQDWIGRGKRINRKVIERFTETGKIAANSPSPVTSWADTAYVCNCLKVTAGELRKSLAEGSGDAQALVRQTRASTVCGSCKPLLEALAGEASSTSGTGRSRSGWLLGISAVALAMVVFCYLFPGFPVAQSVQSTWYKISEIWRNTVIKQITGYTLLSITLIGLVFSLRKRIPKFSLGKFGQWRLFHVAFGLASLIALFVHTGFRFGHNLNFWLMLSFITLNLLGAFAGMVSAMEENTTSRVGVIARRCRRPLILGHVVLFWPFPILLVFHIMSVYFY